MIKNKKARLYFRDGLHMVIIDCDNELEAIEVKKFFNKAKNVNHEKPVQTIDGNLVKDLELSLILSVLSACNNNKTHAAKLLGISLRSLRKKINSLRGSSGN